MIEEILISDVEERYAPPEKVLKVAVVGDIVFLSIGKYDCTYSESGIQTMADGHANIAIHAGDLAGAISALQNSYDRHIRTKNDA